MWTIHYSFCFTSKARIFSYSPMAACLQITSLVIWPLDAMLFINLRWHLISKNCVLFSYSSQGIQKYGYGKRACWSHIILLSLYIGYGCISYSSLWNPQGSFGFEPSSETIGMWCVTLVTVPSFCPLTLFSLWIPLVLFVISLGFLRTHFIPNL